MLELTYNYGVGAYDIGTGFGHLAIEVDDAAATCAAVRAAAASFGGAVTREAGPVKGGTTVIAFVQDPDGYKIELIESGQIRLAPSVQSGSLPSVSAPPSRGARAEPSYDFAVRSSSRMSCAKTSASCPCPTYRRRRPSASNTNVPAE